MKTFSHAGEVSATLRLGGGSGIGWSETAIVKRFSKTGTMHMQPIRNIFYESHPKTSSKFSFPKYHRDLKNGYVFRKFAITFLILKKIRIFYNHFMVTEQVKHIEM